MTWHPHSASNVLKQLDHGLAASELIQTLAEQVEQTDSQLGAFLSFDTERALRESTAAQTTSPLRGIPIAIKDNICTLDNVTTAGSLFLKDFRSPYEATVVKRLRTAGAVVLGKTNLDEFGMGSSTENSAFHPTRNPWDLDRVPGGSSGGSAAAVAAGSSLWALGSDTGGSIRQPSSFCGTTGLKPTYGRVSRFGLIAFASSLDQIGPITNNAADCALLLSIIAGHDPRDATSSRQPVDDYVRALGDPMARLRIGVYHDQLDSLNPDVSATIRQALDVLTSLGASLTNVGSDLTQASVPAYYIIAGCEASSNLARYDGVRYTARTNDSSLKGMYQQSRASFFGAEVKRRVLLGTFALSSGYYDQYYLQASKVRRLVKDEFDRHFQSFDLLIGPTTPTTAFPLSQSARPPLELYQGDLFTVSANLAGIPAISIPCGFVDGLPVGLQLMAPTFKESTLLQVSHQYQQLTDWHERRPEP